MLVILLKPLYILQETKLGLKELLRRIIRVLDFDTVCDDEESRLAVTASSILSESVLKFRERNALPGVRIQRHD